MDNPIEKHANLRGLLNDQHGFIAPDPKTGKPSRWSEAFCETYDALKEDQARLHRRGREIRVLMDNNESKNVEIKALRKVNAGLKKRVERAVASLRHEITIEEAMAGALAALEGQKQRAPDGETVIEMVDDAESPKIPPEPYEKRSMGLPDR